ncbi:GntR family transcriptional regulator [Roseinatronobacter bogoriensis]|uniref:GntR family transcriptional regulator n=1 Tax=Roseinatronobacter bogoriensis subsp. barguzinensis TaxID=441209 RepID=A0A2K8KC08_9RHOB|nr:MULTISPECIES: GntR family transcriptional regulator [Rhodobaca]ATX66967.1 GntR family transcriptional regulator [Rhodobaca barguzinensis]MBB4206459.1 DNA-binding GntR family transcriptional regulator [Rhodobaca bogoriensis DSM 18756]
MSSRRADSVREALEHMIVTGELVNGERLDEISLSEKFGCSRTPLREAFQSLAASGLLELIPHRGAFVRHPDLSDMIEMFEVMAELEAFCGRLAARRVTQQDLAELYRTVIACEDAVANNDSDRYYAENEKFHHLLYKASGNQFLADQAGQLHRRLKPYRRLQLRVRGRLEQSLSEHRAILEALENGNADDVAVALRAHVAVQGGKFNDLMASYKSFQQSGQKFGT